jgi:hypothetical protein
VPDYVKIYDTNQTYNAVSPEAIAKRPMNRSTAGSRPFLKHLALVLSLAGFVVVAVLLIPTKERATMLPPAAPAQTKIDTPPIDANAPTNTKTATFALG